MVDPHGAERRDRDAGLLIVSRTAAWAMLSPASSPPAGAYQSCPRFLSRTRSTWPSCSTTTKTHDDDPCVHPASRVDAFQASSAWISCNYCMIRPTRRATYSGDLLEHLRSFSVAGHVDRRAMRTTPAGERTRELAARAVGAVDALAGSSEGADVGPLRVACTEGPSSPRSLHPCSPASASGIRACASACAAKARRRPVSSSLGVTSISPSCAARETPKACRRRGSAAIGSG